MVILIGCDTFVALPPSTAFDCVIFGKNSDRPGKEVQEVIFVPQEKHTPGTDLQCTYITIPQVECTHSVVLSKPSWMWGAEMGANDKGVVIGNEAIWTKANGPDDQVERLLGMDLLRLGLERGGCARECVDVISSLLETHGQGGPCAEDKDMTYHNSFLIADNIEAWVLETADRHWAAQKITSGVRNISNNVTIGDKIDLQSKGLLDWVKEKGWFSDDKFNFAKCVSASGEACDNPRQINGAALLEKFAKGGSFSSLNMMEILRDKDSGICMQRGGGHVSTGSQVSVLPPPGSQTQPIHFLTATPDPSVSVFKPFVFDNQHNVICQYVISPCIKNDPAKAKPRFSKKVDRRHELYSLHETALTGGHPRKWNEQQVLEYTCAMESSCVLDIMNCVGKGVPIQDAANLFNDCVLAEIKIYKY